MPLRADWIYPLLWLLAAAPPLRGWLETSMALHMLVQLPLLAWIGQRAKQVETLTSVCTGSMLLGEAGLLDGRHATTHWRSLQRMREAFPAVTVEEKLHVVEDGNVLTSAGISAGIDMALRVVARYHGEAVARNTARNMEYRYPDDNSRRV